MLSEARTPWSFVTSRLLYRPKTLLSTVGNTSQLKDTAYFMHTGLPATIHDIHLILCMVTNVLHIFMINTFCIFFFYFWRNAAYFQSELFRNVVQSARKSSECNAMYLRWTVAGAPTTNAWLFEHSPASVPKVVKSQSTFKFKQFHLHITFIYWIINRY